MTMTGEGSRPPRDLLAPQSRTRPIGRRQLERLRAAPLAWRVFIVALAVQLPIVALNVLNDVALHGAFLDLNRETNPPTWFRSELFFVSAIACMIAWHGGQNRRIWGALAFAMLFFSLDDVAGIHDRVEEIEGMETLARAGEAGIGLLVLVAAFAAIRKLPHRPAGFIVAALLLLSLAGGSALLNDQLDEQSGAVHNLLVLAEQWGEMLVGTLVLAAAAEPAAAAIEAWRRAPRANDPSQPRA